MDTATSRRRREAVTITDIARACHVGVTTVSRALNNQPDVSAATRQRIRDMADQLGYRPNEHARNLRATNRSIIALIIKGPTNPFFLELQDRFDAAIRERGYYLSVVRVQHGGDEVAATRQAIASMHPAGLVLLGGWFSATVEEFSAVSAPAVLTTVPYAEHLPENSYSSVAIDDERGIREVVTHLHGLGHRRIAFLGSDTQDRSIGHLRERAFVGALERLGVRADPDLLMRGDTLYEPYSYEYGHRLAHRLLVDHPDVSAIVAMTDALALAALRAAADLGRGVPRDLSVTGFDGVEVSRFTTPRLTTIEQPADAIVARTCDVLFSLMDGGEHEHVLIPGRLLVSESSAPPGERRG